MSEPILIALVQLFAIVAASRHEELTSNARLIIETYLKQYLNSRELQEYLMLYDELFSFHQLSGDVDDWATDTTLKKMQGICEKINKRLQQKDKVIVFIKFIEFVEEVKKSDSGVQHQKQKQEFEYYQLVRNAFNLTEKEFSDICDFLLDPFAGNINKNNLVIITGEKPSLEQGYKSIFRERLDGKVVVFYLKSVDLFVARNLGFNDLNLNGHYVPKNQSFLLTPGSIMRNQKIAPVYYADIVGEMHYVQQKVDLQFTARDIAFSFKNSDNGIQPFSFTAESGELVGVMGGSGAGKSTLLSLLNGTLPLHGGGIFINGHDLEKEQEKLKGIIGFIPQDDLLIEELTVFQNLYFNARLCFSNMSPMQLTRMILKVLSDVDLSGIRDLVVGSPLNKVISGGQRKRLNIALELIREPFVLFADEPTSGLSSMDSDMVMLLLKEQTLKGRMVMVNIHQPSSNIFKLFDKLLILDKGGFPIYYGNPIDAVTYFKAASNHVNPTESECINCGYVNPEQLFQITEAKTINRHGKVTSQRISSPADWYKLFKKSLQPLQNIKVKRKPLPKNHFKVPDFVNQFRIFSLRNLFIKFSNKQYILLNLLEAPFLAFVLAYLTRYSIDGNYVFGQNKNLVAYLFMSVVVALFLGMMVSAEEIIKDRKILKRESFLTLSRFSYLNSKVLFLFALSALQAVFYVVLGNAILGIKGMAFSYWMVLFSTACFANLVGLNLSSGLNSVVNIYILIPFVLVPQLLLSGVIVPFETLNPSISSSKKVPIVGDLMASRWAFEALAVNQFKSNRYSAHFYEYDKQLSNYSFASGYLIPELHSKIEEVNRNIVLNRNKKETKQYFTLINKELQQLYNQVGVAPPEFVKNLDVDEYNQQVRMYAHGSLDSLSDYFSYHHQLVFSERDQAFRQLANQLGQDGVFELKQQHYNQNLANLVLNKKAEKSIVEGENRLLRKKDPIYMEPESKVGRAHFYAPVKYLGPLPIDTLWFNTGIIWLMTLLLYLTLWHDSLRKLIEFSQRLGKK